MNGTLVGLIVASGVLAIIIALVVAKLVQPGRSNALLKVGMTIVLFVTFYSVGISRVEPQFTQSRMDAEFDELIATNVAFQALNEHVPEAIARTREYLHAQASGELGAAEMETRLRAELTSVVGARLGKASDEALLNLIELTVDEVDWLSRRDDDSCFALLFPGHGASFQPSKVFSDDLIERDLQSTAFILSTYDANRPVPDEQQAMAIMQPIYDAAFQKFGTDAVLELGQPGAPGADRKRMCAVMSYLYTEILARPADQAVTALRWMLN